MIQTLAKSHYEVSICAMRKDADGMTYTDKWVPGDKWCVYVKEYLPDGETVELHEDEDFDTLMGAMKRADKLIEKYEGLGFQVSFEQY